MSGIFEYIAGWKKAGSDDEIFSPIEDKKSIMEPHENTEEDENRDT